MANRSRQGKNNRKAKGNRKNVKNDYSNVFWLGLTSLFTDVSTEMLAPILPLFLSTVLGVGGPVIGLIEGIAKGSEHIFSVFSGWLSDRMGRRKPVAVFGYALAAVMKGTYAFVSTWEQLFIARLLDRSGKAIRNPPRDALLAESLEKDKRRTGFAIHRVLDTVGAILGPLVTIAFLIYIGVNVNEVANNTELLSSVARNVFLLSLIPGVASVLIIAFFVKEAKLRKKLAQGGERLTDMLKDMLSISKYGREYRVFLVTSVLFYLAVPTMAFFYLRASNLGLNIENVLLLASFFSITYIIGAALFGFVAGKGKDRESRTFIAWTIALSAVIFAAISLIEQSDAFILLFGAFGFVFGVLEVETRTYVSSIVKERILGGAFGTWRTATGFSMIASGIMLGILWDVSASHMFTVSAAIAFVSFLYFILNK